jgi:hypothetical protein
VESSRHEYPVSVPDHLLEGCLGPSQASSQRS